MKTSVHILAFLTCFWCAVLWSEDKVLNVTNTPEGTAPVNESLPEVPTESVSEDHSEDDSESSSGSTKSEAVELADESIASLSEKEMRVSARLDAQALAGGAVTQGYSLPSVRISLLGRVLRRVSCRLSFGQAREFSTAMLPTLIPVEGFLDFHSHLMDPKDLDSYTFKFRFGLFTPTISPWWTPDLSDIAIPDYFESHRRILINRDIGAEISVQPLGKIWKIGLGAFNGSGIFGLNTNSTKAFTAFSELKVPIGLNTYWGLGGGYQYAGQATLGSTSYRAQAIYNAYTYLWFPFFKWTLEAFGGRQQDSLRDYPIQGGASQVELGFSEWFRFFVRGEYLNRFLSGNSEIFGFQAGPWFNLADTLKTFLFFQALNAGTGSVETMGVLRIRLDV